MEYSIKCTNMGIFKRVKNLLEIKKYKDIYGRSIKNTEDMIEGKYHLCRGEFRFYFDPQRGFFDYGGEDSTLSSDIVIDEIKAIRILNLSNHTCFMTKREKKDGNL